MKRLAILLVVFWCIGCAKVRYTYPYSSMSAERQETLAESIATTFAKLKYSRLRKKKVAFRIWSLDFKGKDTSSLDDYIRAFIEEKVSEVDGRIVTDEKDADIFMLIRLTSSGVQTTERELEYENYPVFYSVTITALSGVDIIGYDRNTKKVFRFRSKDKATIKDKIFLLRIFGEIELNR